MRGGQPFAIIYRMSVGSSDEQAHPVLGVKTIGRAGRRRCLVAWVDGALPGANDLARRDAHSRAATFRCGRDGPRLVGHAAGVPVD